VCGIAGICASNGPGPIKRDEVDAMCNAIIHRGPDDQGTYVNPSVGLGMRRLSIIDVAGGHQPIFNEDESIAIVYNGEVYNFPELREELVKRGHRFRTNSDTETIVHGYEEYGTEIVRRLRGMFAFALYDIPSRKLVLARDRLGKKPLHYAIHRGLLYFASEIKSILAVAPELAETNEQSILHFFYFGYVPEDSSAFNHIQKLPPGHLLEFQDGECKIQKYWEFPVGNQKAHFDEEECLAEFEWRLQEAVKIRLISDVPLGAFLSGGVDSSTIVALMARINSGPVKTFSIDFSEQEFSEAKHARRVARHFKTEHHELTVEPNFGELLQTLSVHLEEPFADSSAIPTFYVSRLARQHVTVCLSGDGGDEVFAGYERYGLHLSRTSASFLKGPLGAVYRKMIFPLLPSATLGKRLVFNLSLADDNRYLDSVAYLPAKERERSLFAKDYLAWADQQESPIDKVRRMVPDYAKKEPLDALQWLDANTYLPSDILVKVDRMSMANSLECRAPLLDHSLIEWASEIPAAYRIRNGEQKYILKKLAERVGVPKEAIYRKKQGFAMPLVNWFRKELKESMIEILTDQTALERGYLEKKAVRRMIDEHLTARRDHSGTLWQLMVFELWNRNFVREAVGMSAMKGSS
jgi:asparagine synthase (glutamine-hydrolysing)